VTVTDPLETGDMQAVEIQGTVLDLFLAYDYLLVYDGTRSRQFTVLVDSTTRVMINGKQAPLSALAPDQIITVAGKAYAGSEKLDATTITVTGTFELVPSA
jgi:hypothetical protein